MVAVGLCVRSACDSCGRMLVGLARSIELVTDSRELVRRQSLLRVLFAERIDAPLIRLVRNLHVDGCIVVAAHADDEDELRAIAAGALVLRVPVRGDLFVARLGSLARCVRSTLGEVEHTILDGDRLFVDSARLTLMPKERELLVPLLEHREHFVPTEALAQHCKVTSPALRRRIWRLRARLGQNAWHVCGKQGTGYGWTDGSEVHPKGGIIPGGRRTTDPRRRET